MSKINIRKPAFMRDDALMEAYVKMYREEMDKASDPKVTEEKRYNHIKRSVDFLDKAAEAGGFLRTLDLVRFLDEK